MVCFTWGKSLKLFEANQNNPRIACYCSIDLCDDCARFSAGEKQRDSSVASVVSSSHLHLGSQRAQALLSTDEPMGRPRQQKVGREQRMCGAHASCPKVSLVSPAPYSQPQRKLKSRSPPFIHA